jgi:hypothetical protein
MRIAKIRGLSQFWALRRDLDIVSESSHESLDVLYRGHILHPCHDIGTMQEDP